MSFRPQPVGSSGPFGDRDVFRGTLTVIELAKDKMAFNFLWGEEASAIRGCRRVKRDFDPVITSSVSFRLAVCVCGKVGAYDNITATQEMGVTFG